MNINIGDQFTSRWGLQVTIINIRDTTAKRNILIGYNDGVTGASRTELVSERELGRRYPFHTGHLASLAYAAARMN